ncbi:hypothetical protein LQF76_05620 [Gloeomargaritales cyanobacterium VI4D9]|nr:hypothetical protein LQF76_05620 [Gloeomargaritales cyanobacterium VI4D9]
MTERLGKRVSRSITFYPTPEDSQLLEELDRRAAAQQMTFSELCKMALYQFVQGDVPAPTRATSPYTVCFAPHETALQQQIEAELTAQGMNFSDWVKQRLIAPTPLESRVQHLEQVVARLQHQPQPPTRLELEQMIAQMLEQIMHQPPTPNVPAVPPPPPPKPPTDPLIAELGALLLDDF